MATKAAKKKPAAKRCRCAQLVNRRLERNNARLYQPMHIDFDKGKAGLLGPALLLEKIDSTKRKELPTVACAYCPFCGKRYPE